MNEEEVVLTRYLRKALEKHNPDCLTELMKTRFSKLFR